MSYEMMHKDNHNTALDSFKKNIDRIFSDFFELEPVSLAEKDWCPKVDVEDVEGKYLIKADLPGVDAKNLDVTFHENTLTLSGSREEEKNENGKNYVFSERSIGKFSRSIFLPDGANVDAIKAEFKNGVLHIEVPKNEKVDNKIKVSIN